MKEQLFKIFQPREEELVNKFISEGWTIVHFHTNHWLYVLFEREKK